MSLASDIGNLVKTGFCAWADTGAKLMDGASGLITGQAYPFNGPRVLHSLACDVPPVPPPPNPYTGGQCLDASYSISSVRVNGDTGAESDLITNSLVGPISGPFTEPRSNGLPGLNYYWRHNGGDKGAQRSAPPGFTVRYFDIVRTDGLPDDCGNPEYVPGPRPDTEPDYGGPHTIPSGGGDVTVNIDHIGHKITNKGDINVYVDVEIDGVRGPGIVPISPFEDPEFSPTDFLPEIPDWVGYDYTIKDLLTLLKDLKFLEDQFSETLEWLPPSDPPASTGKAIKEVDITITEMDNGKLTRWAFADGRDIVVPYMALFSWVYETPTGAQAVSGDEPVKFFKQRFVCPSERGAVGFIVHTRPGVSYVGRVHLWVDIDTTPDIVRG